MCCFYKNAIIKLSRFDQKKSVLCLKNNLNRTNTRFPQTSCDDKRFEIWCLFSIHSICLLTFYQLPKKSTTFLPSLSLFSANFHYI